MDSSKKYLFGANWWWVCDCGRILMKHDGDFMIGMMGGCMSKECACGREYGHSRLKHIPIGYLLVFQVE